MGNIGDQFEDTDGSVIAVPTVGTAGPTYAATVNAILTETMARLSSQIPLSSLISNADLDLNGQKLIDVGYMTLVDEGASPVASPTNRVTSYGGNMWWVGPAGAVQLTSGDALNSAAIGGLTGDYSGAGPMELRYDTATTRYSAFSNQSTNTWAYFRALGLEIAGGATSTKRVRLAYGGSVDYTVTFPAAAPASTLLVQMAATGQLSASNTAASTITAPDFKYSSQRRQTYLPAHQGFPSGGAVTFSTAGAVAADAGSATYFVMLDLCEGDQLAQVNVRTTKSTTATATFLVGVFDANANTFTAVESFTSALSGTNNKICTLASPRTVGTNEMLYLEVTLPVASDTWHWHQVLWSRP